MKKGQELLDAEEKAWIAFMAKHTAESLPSIRLIFLEAYGTGWLEGKDALLRSLSGESP